MHTISGEDQGTVGGGGSRDMSSTNKDSCNDSGEDSLEERHGVKGG